MAASTEEPRVSRRSFMTAAGIGVASTALGAVTVSSAQAQEWDNEADVVVVGSGGAALSGAIGALDNGATVIVLEKAPIIGGTTAKSGGGCWIPNSHHMRDAGLADNKDDFMRYSARVAFPELYRANRTDYGMTELWTKLMDTFWERASVIHEHMDKTGASPQKMAMSWEGKPAANYSNQLPESGGVMGRQTEPRREDGSAGAGRDMIKAMSTYAQEHGAQILTEHAVTKIIREADGRVVGVEANTPDGLKTFRAHKGVIFGSGGFTQNPEMRTQYLRTPILGGCAVPTNTGDFILMASEVGAKLGGLNQAWNMQEILEEVLEFSSVPSGLFFLGGDSAIAVNKAGQRMYDEKYIYPERGKSHGKYDIWTNSFPDFYQVLIFDEKAREFGGTLMPPPGAELPKHIISADTIADLAVAIQERFDSLVDKIGPFKLDDDFLPNLEATIERYNGFAETGVDLDFHRGESPIDRFFHAIPVDRGLPNPYMAPIAAEGPYYAVLLGPGTLDTKGGPVYNESAQVLDVHDQPIPGLYAAGNCGASPSGQSYLGGGGTLGMATTFGYIAGEHAALQQLPQG